MLSKIHNLKHQKSKNFFLIAGPCLIEDEETCVEIAERLIKICDKLEIPLIFKGSYRKANRTKLDSFTGIGNENAITILNNIRKKYKIPVTTDLHSVEEIQNIGKYVDILQVPAFLSRQTELLIEAAKTGKIVNIKKGQFLSPNSMKHAIDKIKLSGNKTVMVTERGNIFGYQDLIVDFRGVSIIKEFGVPVIMDITHSIQKPNQVSGVTGGDPGLIETIAKAGIATGADGIFLETHPNPSLAKSDGASMLKLGKVEDLLIKLVKIRQSII